MSNNELVKDYLGNINDELFNSSGVRLPDSVINRIVTKYEDSDLEVDALIESVNEDVQAYIDEVVEIYSEDELNGLILVSYSNFIFENSSSEISSLFKKLECNG